MAYVAAGRLEAPYLIRKRPRLVGDWTLVVMPFGDESHNVTQTQCQRLLVVTPRQGSVGNPTSQLMTVRNPWALPVANC